MSLYSLKSVLKKLMILNSNRMAQIRDQFTITLDENAEYEERYKEAEWYASALDDIDESERLNAVEGDVEHLKKNIQAKLEVRYDEILDKTRRKGAGTMREMIEWGPERKDDRMSQDDRKFLRSCGIKTERGETWL